MPSKHRALGPSMSCIPTKLALNAGVRTVRPFFKVSELQVGQMRHGNLLFIGNGYLIKFMVEINFNNENLTYKQIKILMNIHIIPVKHQCSTEIPACNDYR